MVHAVPARGLWPEVRGYCGYEEHSAAAVRRLEVPAPQVTVILSMGPSIDILDSTPSAKGRHRLGSFVASLHDSPVLAEYSGHQHGWR